MVALLMVVIFRIFVVGQEQQHLNHDDHDSNLEVKLWLRLVVVGTAPTKSLDGFVGIIPTATTFFQLFFLSLSVRLFVYLVVAFFLWNCVWTFLLMYSIARLENININLYSKESVKGGEVVVDVVVVVVFCL